VTRAEQRTPLLQVHDLRRTYTRGDLSVPALDGVDLVVNTGELLAIEGASGSGKSTLLAVLGGLERPSSGSVLFEGRDLATLDDRALTALRAREIGFVFQSFNLVPTLTAQQNVEAVMAPLGLSSSARRRHARELLDRVGLGARTGHLPSTMSGGEQQRVAVARAIANNPRVILADEPTGNLDSATAEEVVSLLRGLTSELGVTVVLVTHDHDLALQAERRVVMRDGRVVAGDPGRPSLSLVPPVGIDRPALPRSVAWIGRAAAAVALTGTAVAASHLSPGAADTVKGAQLSAGSRPHVAQLAPGPVPQPPTPHVSPAAVPSTPPPVSHAPLVRHVALSKAKPAAPRRTASRKPVVPVVAKPTPVPAKPKPSASPVPPVESTPAPAPDPTTGTTTLNPLWYLFPIGQWWQIGSGR
jgi:putative ABC transport system ATP-binding protein